MNISALCAVVILATTQIQVSPRAIPTDVEAVLESSETLKGMKAFYVKAFVADVLQKQLTTASLQNAVELRLRQNGIGVVSYPSQPELYVGLNAIEQQGIGYVWDTDVSVLQFVGLDVSGTKGTKRMTLAPVWHAGGFGYRGLEATGGDLKNTVLEYVDRFLNAYLTANPKK
jgi:hypothetical protein